MRKRGESGAARAPFATVRSSIPSLRLVTTTVNDTMAARETTVHDRPLMSPQYTAQILQTVFFAIFGLATMLLLVLEFAIVVHPSYLTAVVMVTLATALPLLRPFSSLHYRPWMLAMPILDFLAILVIRLEGASGVTNPMVMMLALPAAWVGIVHSRAAIAILAPFVVAIIAPDVALIVGGTLDESSSDRAIMLITVFPIVIILAMVAAYLISAILADRQTELGTEQKQRATAARETESMRRLLDTVLDTLDVGVAVMTPDGDRLLMNRLLRENPELTGGGADAWESFIKVRSFEMDRVTPIADGDSSLDRLLRGEFVSGRVEWVGVPGRRQTAVSISTGAAHTESGEHVASVFVVKDVTEFLQALEAKDAFIGTVSHELRTPLTTMSGFLELVLERRGTLDPEVVEWLDVMERNVQRQQMLVRDLLAAAGSRTAPITIDRQPGDLAAVVRESVAALRSQAAAAGVKVTVTGCEVMGSFDSLRLAQVTENLLSNAVRYTPGGGSVRVIVSADAEHLTLLLRDTGVGIEPADLERLFERFFRAAEARVSVIHGVGLGLPIVKAIVDAHGGSIDVSSTVGKGTTVTVRLPR